MSQKLATWFIFGVVIALTPFAFEFLRLADRGESLSTTSVLGTGQLLLVCAAIAAGAMGELVLVEVPSNRKFAKLVSIGGCVIVVIVTSLWFGDVSSAVGSGEELDPGTVTAGSLIMFVATLGTSAACLALSLADVPSGRPDESSRSLLEALRSQLEARS